ncbi:MAG: hypothetical protein QOF33_1008 [Thermomicrobiales bacterium]|jgi:Uma2 family endonuclease|nr:hypothetical protein [Thermomicrobiales bacterium]
MVATRAKPVTVEELWGMRGEPFRLALIDGKLYRMPGAGGTHGALQMTLGMHLGPFILTRKLGKIYGDTGFRLIADRDTTLFPDVAFVRSERVPALEQEERFLHLAPDLAIEIYLPNDYPKLLQEKLREYLAAGTLVVWVLYPRSRAVHIHRPGEVEVVLGPDDMLEGGDILPGFTIRVGDLFVAPY